jgi:hypothetical protein
MLKTRRSQKTIAARVARIAPAGRRRAVRPAGLEMSLGRLVGWDERGPLVDFDGNRHGPVRARIVGGARGRTSAPAGAGLQRGPAAGPDGQDEVVLLLDPRPGRAPILIGLLQPLGGERAAAGELEARVDGRRVELDGRDEIVLRCGQASITLRSNGRVMIQGVRVETRARGVNRIKGGAVEIN